EDAIHACREARVPLVVAGTGPLEEELRGRYESEQVRFLGHVSPRELSEWRARAAVAVVPSRCQENFPLAAVEAMAAGVPVVATRVGGVPELVEGDGLVGVGDIAGLAQKIAARYGDRAIGDRAISDVKTLTQPSSVAAKLRSIYDQISCDPLSQVEP